MTANSTADKHQNQLAIRGASIDDSTIVTVRWRKRSESVALEKHYIETARDQRLTERRCYPLRFRHA